jgi:hypothetical protein
MQCYVSIHGEALTSTDRHGTERVKKNCIPMTRAASQFVRGREQAYNNDTHSSPSSAVRNIYIKSKKKKTRYYQIEASFL